MASWNSENCMALYVGKKDVSFSSLCFDFGMLNGYRGKERRCGLHLYEGSQKESLQGRQAF